MSCAFLCEGWKLKSPSWSDTWNTVFAIDFTRVYSETAFSQILALPAYVFPQYGFEKPC